MKSLEQQWNSIFGLLLAEFPQKSAIQLFISLICSKYISDTQIGDLQSSIAVSIKNFDNKSFIAAIENYVSQNHTAKPLFNPLLSEKNNILNTELFNEIFVLFNSYTFNKETKRNEIQEIFDSIVKISSEKNSPLINLQYRTKLFDFITLIANIKDINSIYCLSHYPQVIYKSLIKTVSDGTKISVVDIDKTNLVNKQILSFESVNYIKNDLTDRQTLNIEYIKNANEKVDVLLADLVLGNSLTANSFTTKQNNIFGKPSSLENQLLQNAIKAIKKTGRIIAIVHNSLLLNKKETTLRRKLIEANYIESIINLPKTLYLEKSISSSLLVINKQKSEHQSNNVIFFDLGNSFFDKSAEIIAFEAQVIKIICKSEYYSNHKNIIVVSNDEIADNDYVLSPKRYLHEYFHHYYRIITNSRYKAKLRDFVRKMETGKKHEPVFVAQHDNKSVGFVDKSSLRKARINKVIEPEKLKRILMSKSATVIDYSCVLVEYKSEKMKPVLFEYRNQPIILSHEIMAIQVKEHISREEFIPVLQSKLIEVQHDILRKEGSLSRIRSNRFLDMVVVRPELEQQKELLIDLQDTLNNEKIKQLESRLNSVTNAINKAEHDVVATISHNLNQKLGSLIDDFESIKKYISRKNEQYENISLNDPIAPVFEDEDESDVDTLGIVISRFSNNLLDATQTLKTTEEIVQKNSVNRQLVKLKQFFRNDIQKCYKDESYDILISGHNGEEIDVEIDRNAFKDAIRNLIINAKKHGFVDNRKHTIVFEIEKCKRNDTEFARIVYKNDGNPLPAGFSFDELKRLTGKAGNTKGKGLGGYFVNKVINLHNGSFNQINDSINISDPYKVKFEILLPLAKIPTNIPVTV